MTQDEAGIPNVDEQTERLICRSLDDEATPDERAELAGLLLRNPAARALYDEYRGIGDLAAAALQREFENATTAAAGSVRRGLWLATAGAVLTAAAVLAFSFVPSLWSGRYADSTLPRKSPIIKHASPSMPQVGEPTYVNYRGDGSLPRLRQRDIHRDVIGIRGPNNEIYIFERNKQSTRMTPISGDL